MKWMRVKALKEETKVGRKRSYNYKFFSFLYFKSKNKLNLVKRTK